MELNGLANLQLILLNAQLDGKVDADVERKCKEQLDLLERYLIAYADWVSSIKPAEDETRAPYWHEVKANPSEYKRNR
jgi:hypothetical protein